MLVLPAHHVPALRPWFTPERPGPMIWSHIAATGHGRCRVDRWPDPRVVVAELAGGNYAIRGDPAVLSPAALADVAGFVEAAAEWLPALRQLDPDTCIWNRVIAVLPDDVAGLPSSAAEVRRLGPDDTTCLAGLSSEMGWIHETWGGPTGLAAAGVGWAAVVGGRPVSVAVPFFVGEFHEDIGVVTERSHRQRGLSTACAAAVVADIRARGHRPTWTTAADNPGSLAVAARLGFTHVRDDVLYAVSTLIPVDD